MARLAAHPVLQIHPLTPERWDDFEKLFGAKGACAGCWCTWWRLSQKEFIAGKGAKNRNFTKALVEGGSVPGLLAYVGGEPVGWVALAPREEYPRLARSKVLAPVDSEPVWSVTCFFVKKAWRRKGVTVALLQGAKEFASSRGAAVLEGYPVEAKGGKIADVFAYTGLTGSFLGSGFREVLRRSPTRPVVRVNLEKPSSGNVMDG